jgi:hypothetical protein
MNVNRAKKSRINVRFGNKKSPPFLEGSENSPCLVLSVCCFLRFLLNCFVMMIILNSFTVV